MADVTVTPANVKADSGDLILARRQAGEAIDAGEACYRSATDGKWYLGDSDDTAVTDDISTLSGSIGVAATSAAGDEDYFHVAIDGPLNFGGAIFTMHTAYYWSDTAGGIKPATDLDAGDVAIYLGTPDTTSILNLKPQNHLTALAS